MALNQFVLAPDEEIFMDATGTSLPSPGQAQSTQAYYVDGAQSLPTGREALIRRIQAVPVNVMFQESNDPTVEVKTLSFEEIDCVVHYMKDGMHERSVSQAGWKLGQISSLVGRSKFDYGEINQERVRGEGERPYGQSR